jgi:acetyl esterase/lipase
MIDTMFYRALTIFVFLCASLAGRCRADGDTVRRNVVYETIDGKNIALDIAVPNDKGRFPLVVCFHGGAWSIGDKSKFARTIDDLAHRGFVAASINYRFAPKYPWPAQLDDARAAVLFLKRHADQYKIDPTHVGGLGESAGAQLVMLLAFEPDAPRAMPLTSTRLQAVVNYYGPVDLGHWQPGPLMEYLWQKEFHESVEDMMAQFLGSRDPESPQVKSASPINFVDKNCPPVLTFHGTLDFFVPFSQAQMLHEKLKKAGVPEQLVPIPNGMHGGWAPQVRQDCTKQAVHFLERNLKGIDTDAALPITAH